MSTHTTIDLLICDDCALYAANRDTSGSSAHYTQWIEAEGAHMLAPVTVGDHASDFHPRPCEVCQALAGSRWYAYATEDA